MAHRAWLCAAAVEEGLEDGVPEDWARDSVDIAYMLDRIARAGPEEKVILLCMNVCICICTYIHVYICMYI